MLGKMASFEEESRLRQIIQQARHVRDTFTFKMGGVLDYSERLIHHTNSVELEQLDRAIRAYDEFMEKEDV